MTDKKINRTSLIVLSLSVIILIAGSALLLQNNPAKHNTLQAYAEIGGDFVLQSAEGPVSLSDYKDKVIVLYFGYAFCPDVCPTSLGLLSLALQKLKPEELKKIQAFFISVDPERDTVDKLKTYTAAFHPSIKGITGTKEQLADIAKRYGVMYMKVNMPNSAMGYAVDHSSRYYVMDSDGKVKTFIEHGTSPDDIVATLRSVM
ncbi:MAG: SCO family protein [Gammaproteobacteria bacterium]|nr:SCO family protein [Gammaproteobacteria bacterium]MCW9031139.1 SCO family protein [Gammaproteobacteria bacterium]